MNSMRDQGKFKANFLELCNYDYQEFTCLIIQFE